MILMGLRLHTRIIAQCNWIVTEPTKALISLAQHLKNRFTSCASFPGQHSSVKATRPASQDSNPASSPGACSKTAPPKDIYAFSREESCSSSGFTVSALAHLLRGTALFRRIAPRFVSRDFDIMKCPARTLLECRSMAAVVMAQRGRIRVGHRALVRTIRLPGTPPRS